MIPFSRDIMHRSADDRYDTRSPFYPSDRHVNGLPGRDNCTRNDHSPQRKGQDAESEASSYSRANVKLYLETPVHEMNLEQSSVKAAGSVLSTQSG